MSGVEDCLRNAANCTSRAQEIADHNWHELIGILSGGFKFVSSLAAPVEGRSEPFEGRDYANYSLGRR